MGENGSCQGGGERHQFRAGKGKGGKMRQVLRLEDLYSWWMGMRELHVDWQVKVPASSGRCDYPSVGYMWGPVGLDSYLAPRPPLVILLQNRYVTGGS